jgi:hypothetical protein
MDPNNLYMKQILNSFLKNITSVLTLIKKITLFYIHFLLFPIYIFSSPVVEKVDTSDFPKIQIHVREELNKPIQNEIITIRENSESITEDIVKVDLLKKSSTRPIRLVLAIQASSASDNSISRVISENIIKNLSDDDKISLFVYSNDEMIFLNDTDRNAIYDKLASLPVGKSNKVFQNLTKLLNKIPQVKSPTFLLLISHSNATDTLDPNNKLINLSEEKHIRVHSLTKDETIGSIFNERTNGNKYSFNDRLLINNIISNLNYLKKRPTTLEYSTPFESYAKDLNSHNVNVKLKIGDLVYNLNYKVSLIDIIESKLEDVEFVFSILISFLILCFFIYYSRLKNDEKKLEAVIKNKRESKYKADLYYHENNAFHEGNKVAVLSTSSYSQDDEDDFLLQSEDNFRSSIDLIQPASSTKDLPRGEKYASAFLIQKEGPNPGRQFNITMDEIEIGNSTSNDLILKDLTISNKQAKIKKINGSYYIYDLVSQRGTFVNGKKILKPKALRDFDEIRLGRTLLLFRGK